MLPFYQMNSKMRGKGGDDVDFSDDTWGGGPAAGVIGSKRGGGNFGGRGGGNLGSSGGNYGRPGGAGGFPNDRARGPGGPAGFGNRRGPGGPGGFGGGGGRNWDGDDGWDNRGGPVGNDYNRDRYSNAYGNYQGGYGPPRFGGPPAPLMGPVFGPRGPGFEGGPGPGFQGGPGPMRPLNPVKFLTRCGVGMNTIQSWPRSVLRLCMPNHCGVCSMDCDNFAFARMHYTSKNHAKHTKKFMLDNHNAGPIEDPLKARDLYCELCDVHITSKVHGDSHYAGKSHRSIVEGNKPPKNPKLNQPGAQNRRDRLLKRELRFLKQEPATAQTAAKKDVEIKKGEWYCEICKSNMSCSDQMTAHMNGKKHLSKEKQHILNVMKGEKEAKEKAAAAAAAGNETADAEVNEIHNVDDDETYDVDDDETDDVEENNIGDAGAAAAPEDDSWVHGTGEGWDNENNASGESEEPLLFVRRE